MRPSRLIILTGPSGVGKTPLEKSLNEFFPEIGNRLQKVVLYNSRKPRPGEKDGYDYHFRSIKYLNKLRNNDSFIVVDVRGDTQALNLFELEQLLLKRMVLFEGNTYLALKIFEKFKSGSRSDLLSIFLSPLSKIEIELIRKHNQNRDIPDLITKLIYNKIERRLRKYGQTMTPRHKENLLIRSKEAYSELKIAWNFDWVIPNHDGEDSDNWSLLPYPIGDARISLHTFRDLLQSGYSEMAEKWEKDLFR